MGEPGRRAEDSPGCEGPLPGGEAGGGPIWEVMDNSSGQDNDVWQSQGPITPRWTEMFGGSDKGIILYRRLLRDQMAIVADGGDPMNTFRDPAANVSIHVPHERDDPTFRGRSGEVIFERLEAGAIRTGQSGKYSPISQERAAEAGFGVPDKVEKEAAEVGYIAPR